MADPNDIWTTVGQIGTWLAIGGGLVLLDQVRNRIQEWYRIRKLHPIARSVQANRRVHSLLVELRTKTDADRACVFLFHNGQVFSNKNPLWRVSCTQEYCRDGISHEIDSLQNILASMLWDGLAPLFGMDLDMGISTRYRLTHNVYVMDVVQMNDSYYKRSLIARGVRTNIVTPILDRSEIVGYVALNYNELTPQVNNLDMIVAELSDCAGNVHYELNRL